MQSTGAMRAKNLFPVANYATEQIQTRPEASLNIAKSPAPLTALHKIVKVVAGGEAANDSPNNPRLAVAKEIHNFAHNQSKLIDKVTAGLNIIYLAGATLGKPLTGLVNSARRIEQALSMGRRFVTGAKVNSPLRMLASIAGVSNIFTKEVGQKMYLKNWFNVWLSNEAENALKAANDADKTAASNETYLENGAYKSMWNEPKALIKKLTSSLKELSQNPALIKDMDWFAHSQLGSILNAASSAMVATGLSSGHEGLARTGRSLQAILVDKAKIEDEASLGRQASGVGFLVEAGLDAANDAMFKGKSTRVSSLVALVGQASRTLGSIYQDIKPDGSAPLNPYKNPVQLFFKSLKSLFINGNPVSLLTKKYDESMIQADAVKSVKAVRTTPRSRSANDYIYLDHSHVSAESQVSAVSKEQEANLLGNDDLGRDNTQQEQNTLNDDNLGRDSNQQEQSILGNDDLGRDIDINQKAA